MVRYSMGFIVSEDGQSVLLLCKNRPAFLVGKWTGIGGHIEEGETPREAMVRECEEECGLKVAAEGWQEMPTLFRPSSEISIFLARADLSLARSVTDEPVQVFTWDEAFAANLSDSAVEMLPIVQATLSLRAFRPR